MRTQKDHLALGDKSRLIAIATAAIATTATFAKSFVPFYLVGSTPIFVAACLVGAFLVVLTWRDIRENARYVTDILVVFGLLYAVVVANYSVYSFGKVPITHLVGILVFHALFLIFGFAAARGLKTV